MVPMVPRDGSVSDSYASERCCFSCRNTGHPTNQDTARRIVHSSQASADGECCRRGEKLLK